MHECGPTRRTLRDASVLVRGRQRPVHGDASVLFVGGVGNTKAELSVVSGFKPVAMALRYARIDCTYCGASGRGGELEHRPRRARETGKASSEHIGVVFLL